MKILLINGVNLNMLGVRQPELYGKTTLKELVKKVKTYAKTKGVKITPFQSNDEGKIVTRIQKALNRYDGIIINAGAYSHTSIAILDALKGVNIKTAEVHLTDVYKREEYRRRSYISEYAEKVITGKGTDGYLEAVDFFVK